MPLSRLMLAILEQAKEPLLCLHGAGYFTEEEWIQLDLIINKKYLWTTGPATRSRISKSTPYNANKASRNFQSEVKAHAPKSDADKISSSLDEVSICTSVEPLSDDVEIQPASTDTPWELSPAMTLPTPIKSKPNELNETTKKLSNNRPAACYTLVQLEEARAFNANFMNRSTRNSPADRLQEPIYSKINPHEISSRHKSVSSWASEVCNNRLRKSDIRPIAEPLTSSPEITDPPASEITTASRGDDVNAYETSNAAEWDDPSFLNQKRQTTKKICALIEDDYEQNSNSMNYVRQGKNLKQSATTTLHPRTEMRNIQSITTVDQTNRDLEAKESKESMDRSSISVIPKTKICWFWAESVAGCRYRAEECINLHIRPEPGTSPNYPLKDGRPICGSLADTIPQKVPPGKRSRSCWFWATKGTCDKGDSCEYVHGWVSGGVASRPKNFDAVSKLRHRIAHAEESYYSRENSGSDVLELNEIAVDDRVPRGAAKFDPKFMVDWIP